MPKFPSEDFQDDQNDNYDNLDGTQEMFGIKIRQDTDKKDLVNSSPTRMKR